MPKKKRPTVQRGQQVGTDLAGAEIQRLWEGMSVVDAEKELRVIILPEDLADAKRGDPASCVFARAVRRSFSATNVLFFRNVAYLDLPAEDGTRRVERFMMSDGMRALVESFDRGEGVIPEAGFCLRAPTSSQRLGSPKKREAQRARRVSQERDQIR